MQHHGQVWLETVIYTLVGLALLGLVLGIVTPQINEYRDRAIIEQSVSVLNNIDAVIRTISADPGNARVIDVRLKQGAIEVNSIDDIIRFELDDSAFVYSEPGLTTLIGDIEVLTEEIGSRTKVSLTLNYSGKSDLSIESGDQIRSFSASSVPYRFRFENRGLDNSSEPMYMIDFREISGG